MALFFLSKTAVPSHDEEHLAWFSYNTASKIGLSASEQLIILEN